MSNRSTPSPNSSNACADDPGGSAPLALGGISAITLSLLATVLGYVALPSRLRIHWTLGLGPYYGPEFAPKVVVLLAFPVVLSAIAVGLWVLHHQVRSVNGFDRIRPYYVATSLVTMTLFVSVQITLLMANL